MYPFESICIDESLVLFKGRISFRQYIPKKRHRFGIKFFVAADCETGYVLDFLIYTGATTEIIEYKEELGKSGNVVMTLLYPYLNKGHKLYIDNWYSSPLLAQTLFENKTNCCGTVKQNRKHMPKLKKNIPKGSIQCFSTDNLLALNWKDKRDVTILTSMHEAIMEVTQTSRGQEVEKPKCIADYNTNMGGVDRTDMLLISTESVRRTIKWYKKVFFHLLDIALINSHSIFKIKTGKNIPLLDFQRDLVKQIIQKYKNTTVRCSGSNRSSDGHSPLRLIERDFPSMFSLRDNRRPLSKRCVVCAKRKVRKETRYLCTKCDVPLCVIDCFERYQTVLKF